MTSENEKDLTGLAELSLIEAQNTTITTDNEYQSASMLLLNHKQRMKLIKDYWEKPKTAAKAAHQEICDKEKAMLEPFMKAETIIKGSMLVYQRKVAEERAAAELEARRLQKIEADRLLAESIKAAEEGKTEQAVAALDLAVAVEAAKPVNPIAAPKAEGISTRKTWKARVIDERKVPVYFQEGPYMLEFRPIKLSVLDELARLFKGQSQVPGVEFYEDVTIRARF